jgi:hypothetical protein
MAFEIIVHEAAVEELEALRMFDQRIIVDAIGEQLKHQPTVPTRRRKSLGALALAFENVPPFGNCALGIFGYSTMWIRRRITFTFGQFAAKNLRKGPRT